MNQGRKAILAMLILVITVALATFIYNKYQSIQKKEEASAQNIDRQKSVIVIDGKQYDYVQENSKYSLSLMDNKSIRDILKNFKYCTISAGFPITVKQNEQNLFEIMSKSPLSIHSDVNKLYDVGDTIIGTGFNATGDSVGQERSFQILAPSSSYVKTVTYTVVPIVNCF